MGFPTRACMEPTSDDAMKQSLRLVRDVSLSMSWNAESFPAERDAAVSCQDAAVGAVPAMINGGWEQSAGAEESQLCFIRFCITQPRVLLPSAGRLRPVGGAGR